jgi:hypothetical protein
MVRASALVETGPEVTRFGSQGPSALCTHVTAEQARVIKDREREGAMSARRRTKKTASPTPEWLRALHPPYGSVRVDAARADRQEYREAGRG